MVTYMIRPYDDTDFEDYAQTLSKTWLCEDIDGARETVEQAVRRTRTNEKTEIWVAEVDGKAVGFILIEFTRIWGHKGESFESEAVGIDWFDIHPEFQGKGLAKELLKKAEERGKGKGLHQVFMHTSVKNLRMVNFASKHGFRFAEYLEDFWGKGTGAAFLLTKVL
jgi:ribosomal protein S18 acetylase RimI-like enzyme